MINENIYDDQNVANCLPHLIETILILILCNRTLTPDTSIRAIFHLKITISYKKAYDDYCSKALHELMNKF